MAVLEAVDVWGSPIKNTFHVDSCGHSWFFELNNFMISFERKGIAQWYSAWSSADQPLHFLLRQHPAAVEEKNQAEHLAIKDEFISI